MVNWVSAVRTRSCEPDHVAVAVAVHDYVYDGGIAGVSNCSAF
jgi:hypothetical protein